MTSFHRHDRHRPVAVKSALMGAGAVLMVCGSWGAAFAAVDELLVTATKREAALQDIPISVTALTADMLEDLNALDLDGFIRSVPNVQFEHTGPGSNEVSIRGVNLFFGQNGTSVGYYFDETPVSVNTFNADFGTFDVDRVEILRGPQGTLYGEGSMGGTLRVISNQPNTEEYEAKLEAGISTTKDGGENWLVNGMANLPIVEDKLALRVVGRYRDDDGFIDNLFLGRNNINDYETYGGRASLRLEATENLTLTASVMASKSNSDDAFFNANEDLDIAEAVPADYDDEYYLYTGVIEYSLPFADFLSSTSYFDRDFSTVGDISPGLILPWNFFFGGFLPAAGFYQDQNLSQEAITEEARLTSTHEGPFQWTLGIFYRDQDIRTFGEGNGLHPGSLTPFTPAEISFLSGAVIGDPSVEQFAFTDITTNFKQLAGFGELSWDVTDSLQLLAGLRVEREKRSTTSLVDGFFNIFVFGGPPPPGAIGVENEKSSSQTVVNPKGTITYNFTDDKLVYVTASRGYRTGGENVFEVFIEADPFLPPGTDVPSDFDEETLWNYEFGWKLGFGDAVTFNGAAYYMDWNNIQVGVESSGPFLAVDNVAGAHTAGVEFEVNASPMEGLDLNVGGAFVEAEVDGDITEGTFVNTKDGADLPDVPNWSFNGGATYTFPLWNTDIEGVAHADAIWYGDAKRSIGAMGPKSEHPGYELVNLSLGVQGESWEIQAFVKNVTNQIGRQLFVREEALGAVFLPENIVPGDMLFVNQPRTFGIVARKQF